MRRDHLLVRPGFEPHDRGSETSDTIPSGKVTRTDPPAGDRRPPGATIKLFISTGKPRR